MNETTLNIIAIGGGRIYAGETKTIDSHISSILPKKNKTLVILPTASKDRPDYIEAIEKEYEERGVSVSVLSEEELTKGKLPEALSISSGLYVGGGDVHYLLKVLKETNSVAPIKEYAKSGKVLAGLSAGAALLFERAIFFEDEKPTSVEGLGILSGIVIPHFSQDVLNKCHDLVLQFGSGEVIYGISNSAAVSFISPKEYRVIAEPYSRGVWKISAHSGTVDQEKL